MITQQRLLIPEKKKILLLLLLFFIVTMHWNLVFSTLNIQDRISIFPAPYLFGGLATPTCIIISLYFSFYLSRDSLILQSREVLFIQKLIQLGFVGFLWTISTISSWIISIIIGDLWINLNLCLVVGIHQWICGILMMILSVTVLEWTHKKMGAAIITLIINFFLLFLGESFFFPLFKPIHPTFSGYLSTYSILVGYSIFLLGIFYWRIMKEDL